MGIKRLIYQYAQILIGLKEIVARHILLEKERMRLCIRPHAILSDQVDDVVYLLQGFNPILVILSLFQQLTLKM